MSIEVERMALFSTAKRRGTLVTRLGGMNDGLPKWVAMFVELL